METCLERLSIHAFEDVDARRDASNDDGHASTNSKTPLVKILDIAARFVGRGRSEC
jgi:hypothetical protein